MELERFGARSMWTYKCEELQIFGARKTNISICIILYYIILYYILNICNPIPVVSGSEKLD